MSTPVKGLAGLIMIWLIVAPFWAGWFPSPIIFLNAPWLLVFGAIVLLSGLAWAAEKLGRAHR